MMDETQEVNYAAISSCYSRSPIQQLVHTFILTHYHNFKILSIAVSSCIAGSYSVGTIVHKGLCEQSSQNWKAKSHLRGVTV